MPDMLYEIGTEELPASYIQPALDQLRQSIAKELEEASLEHGDIYTTATPRRLVLAVGNLAERQPDRDEEIIGPPAKIAFDAQGNPTGAGRGFARSQGVELTALQRKKTPRGEYCTVNKRRKGRDAAELLAEILPRVALKLSFPKSMLWPGSDRPFARPVRSLTALLGDRLIGFTLFGIRTDRAVESHPILAPGALTLPNADLDAYRTLLREHCVVVDADERREIIREKIAALPPDSGVIALPDEDKNALIDEVANLVQYPSVTRGQFKKSFLDIPAPIIKAAMTEHQRYFPLGGKDGLRPYFIVVSDRGPNHADAVRSGNEAVLSARLADAQFFYRIDSASSLADRIPSLDGVQFLTGLGTYRDKCLRLEKLVLAVAHTLGLDPHAASHAARAAQLCKADLVTEMVAEFPKLQGEVGRIYALNDGEPEPVATAILEHYLPRSAGGPLPQTPAGAALSLAEKLDNLAACFALGLIPTGSADPYALRRQSQAVLRIIADSRRPLDLAHLLRAALDLLPQPHSASTEAMPKLLDFFKSRLFMMSLDAGAPHDLIRAALAPGFTDVADFHLRLHALRTLAMDPCWPDLVASVERTGNISRSAPADIRPDPSLYAEPLEKELAALFEQNAAPIRKLIARRLYVDASRRYAEVFSRPLHEFFDKVFVNVEDKKLRANRLALLKEINRLYSSRIADLSQITTGVEK